MDKGLLKKDLKLHKFYKIHYIDNDVTLYFFNYNGLQYIGKYGKTDNPNFVSIMSNTEFEEINIHDEGVKGIPQFIIKKVFDNET